MITFACPQCGKNLSCKDEQAGKKGKCPHCRHPMTVPGGSGTLAEKPGDLAEAHTLQFNATGDTKIPGQGSQPVVGPSFQMAASFIRPCAAAT